MFISNLKPLIGGQIIRFKVVVSPFHCRNSMELKTFFCRFVNTGYASNNETGKLLYKGTENNKIRFLQGATTASSIAIIAAFPKVMDILSGSSIASTIMAASMVLLSVHPIGVYAFVRGYVKELRHNEEKDIYIAHLPSWHIWPDKKLTFSPHTCKMPKTPRMFTSFIVNRQGLFVNSDTMKYRDYSHMLRYTEGLDFENPKRQEEHMKGVLSSLNEKNKKKK